MLFRSDWGYSGQGVPNNGPNSKIPFFKNITVFGINRHEFIAYTLVNPIITRFSHDQYDYDQGSGVMTCNMTIDYETVVYNQGAIEGGDNSGNIIRGFGDGASYDKRLSPITPPESNKTVIGQGGVVPASGGYIKDLKYYGPTNRQPQFSNVAYNYQPPSGVGPSQSEITSGFPSTNQSTDNTGIRNLMWNTPAYGQTGGLVGGNQNPPQASSQSSPIPLNPNSKLQYAGWVTPNPVTSQLPGLPQPPIIV